ncbi:MAG: hypothetical protein HQK66_10335 [Desulfamplus sp.]|nr:hypothetical protein [Desulfamplus sp.]
MKEYIKTGAERVKENGISSELQGLFFPFTVLTPEDVKILSMLFPKVIFISTQSEKEWMDSLSYLKKHGDICRDSFKPIHFSKEDLEKILASLKSFTDWAHLNQGAGRGHLKVILREEPYFKSDTDISSIRAEIEKNRENASHTRIKNSVNMEKGAEYIFRQKLFLRLAHLWDQDQELLDTRLSSVDAVEKKLFNGLKGEPSFPPGDLSELPSGDLPGVLPGNSSGVLPGNSSGDLPGVLPGNLAGASSSTLPGRDRGEFMTGQRMLSWTVSMDSIMDSIMEPIKSDTNNEDGTRGVQQSSRLTLPVTTSPAVVDFLDSVAEKSKLILDIETFKVHKEKYSSIYEYRQTFSTAVGTVLEAALKGEEKEFHHPDLSGGTSLSGNDEAYVCLNVKLHLFSGGQIEKLFPPLFHGGVDFNFSHKSSGWYPVVLAVLKK